MGADGRDRGFVVGPVNAEPREDVQGMLPVRAGLLRLVQRVVGAGEPVVGAGLIVGLVHPGSQRESPVVVGNCVIRVAGGVA